MVRETYTVCYLLATVSKNILEFLIFNILIDTHFIRNNPKSAKHYKYKTVAFDSCCVMMNIIIRLKW